MTVSNDPHSQHGSGHEESDVSLRPLAIGLGAIVALAAGSLLLVAVAQDAIFGLATPASTTRLHRRVTLRELPPEPRLQAAPVEDLREMRAAEEEKLNSYGWVDRSKGIVRIPVDRAMALLAERGGATGGEQGAGK